MDDGDDFYAEEGDGSLVMKVPEKKNQEQSPISNTVSISRDTDEQLHRKIDRLSEQLRDTNKRNEIRVLRAEAEFIKSAWDSLCAPAVHAPSAPGTRTRSSSSPSTPARTSS